MTTSAEVIITSKVSPYPIGLTADNTGTAAPPFLGELLEAVAPDATVPAPTAAPAPIPMPMVFTKISPDAERATPEAPDPQAAELQPATVDDDGDDDQDIALFIASCVQLCGLAQPRQAPAVGVAHDAPALSAGAPLKLIPAPIDAARTDTERPPVPPAPAVVSAMATEVSEDLASYQRSTPLAAASTASPVLTEMADALRASAEPVVKQHPTQGGKTPVLSESFNAQHFISGLAAPRAPAANPIPVITDLVPAASTDKTDSDVAEESSIALLPSREAHTLSALAATPPVATTMAGTMRAEAAVAPAPFSAPVDLRQSDWDQRLSQHLVWMAEQHTQMAEVKLNPAHLGPLEVRLALHHDQASVAFYAPDPSTRELIESALPRLKYMLDSQGVSLQQAQVSDQSLARQQQGDQRAQAQRSRGVPEPATAFDQPSPTRRRDGIVDHYV